MRETQTKLALFVSVDLRIHRRKQSTSFHPHDQKVGGKVEESGLDVTLS
jgi:hypothetical protein